MVIFTDGQGPDPRFAPPAGPSIEAQQLAVERAIRSLQAESRDISRQLQSAFNHRQQLIGQLNSATGSDIPRVTGELATTDAGITELRGTLADINGRIAQLQATNQTVRVNYPPMGPPRGRQMDPNAVAGIMFAFIFFVLMPMSIAMARRIWRGRPKGAAPGVDILGGARLERLEQSVDAIAIEIERIAEGQRFVTKVMTERPTQAPGPSVPNTSDASVLGDAKPFLALGAGPIEPIRVPDRQAVRQSITPH